MKGSVRLSLTGATIAAMLLEYSRYNLTGMVMNAMTFDLQAVYRVASGTPHGTGEPLHLPTSSRSHLRTSRGHKLFSPIAPGETAPDDDINYDLLEACANFFFPLVFFSVQRLVLCIDSDTDKVGPCPCPVVLCVCVGVERLVLRHRWSSSTGLTACALRASRFAA